MGQSTRSSTAADSLPAGATPDLEAEVQRANLRRRLFGAPTTAVRMGRFVVLDLIGAGGMATVFRGYDPDLDRSVALKVIRTELLRRSTNARDRMLREARMMARLSHPNVVTVHEVGVAGEEVFVAMEYVEGQDLQAWHRTRADDPDRLEAGLELLVAAGEGLVAAHAQGIVHRDFKPANVLVGDDGRVRVADFGLARALEAAHSELRESIEVDTHATPLPLHDLITRSGVVVGTPAYLAPEQRMGGVGDARSDQYAFCIAAWEVCFGDRPSPGELPEVPADLDGRGRWVARVLQRGLQLDPQARHDTMAQLLEQLRDDPTKRRRRVAWAAGAALVVSTAGLSYAAERSTRCDDAAQAVHEVWSPARRDAISTAFVEVEPVLGERSWHRLRGSVDDFVARWETQAKQTCHAGRVEHTIDAPTLHARTTCFDALTSRLDSVLDVFEQPDRDLVFSAPEVGMALPSVEACIDHPATPSDDATLDEALARAQGLLDAGRRAQALDAFEKVAAQADDAEQPSHAARAHAGVGHAKLGLGDPKRAAIAFETAVWSAIELGDDALTIGAALGLCDVLAATRSFEQAEHWARLAQTLAKRIDVDPELRADIESSLGRLAYERGEMAQTEQHFRTARDIAVDLYGVDHPRVAGREQNLGRILGIVGKLEEADAAATHALEIQEAYFGPAHPAVATALSNVAAARGRQGRHDEAIAAFRRAVEIDRATLGPNNARVATTLSNMAVSLQQIGETFEAEATTREALRVMEATLDPTDRRLVGGRMNLSRSLYARGRCDEAVPLLEAAIEALQRAKGGPQLAVAQTMLGACLTRQGQPERALPILDAAFEVLSKQPDGGASVEVWIATALQRRGDLDAALLRATSAYERLQAVEGTESTRAELSFRIASIEVDRGNLEDATRHAERALQTTRAVEGGTQSELEAMVEYAAVLLAAGRLEAAEVEARDVLRRIEVEERVDTFSAPARIKLHITLAEALRDKSREGARSHAKLALRYLADVDDAYDAQRIRVHVLSGESPALK